MIEIQLKCGDCGKAGPRAPADDAGDAWRWLTMHADLIHRSDIVRYRVRHIDTGTATAWTQRQTA